MLAVSEYYVKMLQMNVSLVFGVDGVCVFETGEELRLQQAEGTMRTYCGSVCGASCSKMLKALQWQKREV
jgi:hypothetical protein